MDQRSTGAAIVYPKSRGAYDLMMQNRLHAAKAMTACVTRERPF